MINYQKSTLLALVKRHPEGIKEYDLLKLLHAHLPREQQVALFDNLALFQQHFLLFHALYKLLDQQHAAQAGQIIIEPLNIQWLPYKAERAVTQQQAAPANTDPLRAYYLEIKNLEETCREDVDNLLASFWQKMGDNSEQLSALALFELAQPCDLVTIKKRYRQLLATHHPDKGGSVVKTQALNEAMAVLKRCYVKV